MKISGIFRIFLILLGGQCLLYSHPPILKRAIIPAYPPLYRIAHISGMIELEVAVDSKGQVISTNITKHLNDTIKGDVKFVDTMFKKWVFEPNNPGILNLCVILKILPRGTMMDELETEFEPSKMVIIKTIETEPEKDPIIVK